MFRSSADDQSLQTKRLTHAEQLVNADLEYDEKRVDLLERLGSENNGYYHYPKNRLKRNRFVAIPNAILDQYDHLECKSFVGIFPEINRAYITIDNKLFLWNYHDGSEFYPYDELDQIIISCALVKPKPDIFVQDVQYCLVLATPVQVVMLAVVFPDNNVFGELTLYPTKYTIASDNVCIQKIVGTPTGRIFMCGDDGNVYEFDYQADDRWFSRKARKLNHSSSKLRLFVPSFLLGGAFEDPIVDMVYDDSRRHLYTLSKKGVLSVYSLGVAGNEMIFLAKNEQVFREAIRSVGEGRATADWKENKETKVKPQIVTIAVVPKMESEKVVLVAVTNHGHRIYLSYSERKLSVKFVRLCPPAITRPDRNRDRYEPLFHQSLSPNNVSLAYFRDGVLLLSDARDRDFDTLVTLARDSHPNCYAPGTDGNAALLIESVESHPFQTRINDIAEVPASFYMSMVAECLYARGADEPLVGLNEFAVQHALPPRQFLFLTASGLFTLVKLRPVDELKESLYAVAQGQPDAPLKSLFERYGAKEACAMCLVVACDDPTDSVLNNSRVLTAPLNQSDNDPRAFILDEKQEALPAGRYGAGAVVDEELRRYALVAFHQYGGAPTAQAALAGSANPLFGSAIANQNTIHSAKHEGLYLYFSRILRPFWSWTLVVPGDDGKLHSRFSHDQLVNLQAPLLRFQRFIQENARAVFPPQVDVYHMKNVSQAEHEARKSEQESLESLLLLLDRITEALSLLLLLCEQDPDWTGFISKMDSRTQESLREIQYHHLVTSKAGEQLAKQMISALLKDASQEAAWVSELHRRCPFYFGQSDLLNHRANICLQLAKQKWAHIDERQQLLRQALEHYINGSRTRKFDLPSVASQFRDAHFYDGVIHLALARARTLRQELVNEPVSEAEESKALEAELKTCYISCLETLDAVKYGRYPANEQPSIQITEAERNALLDSALRASVQADDEIFHVQLFQWMLANDMREDLLQIKHRDVVRFLQSSEDYFEILAQYYLRHEMFQPAVILFCHMANRRGKYRLEQRVDFLSQAFICAKRIQDQVSDEMEGNRIFDIKDNLETAKLQQSIHIRLSALVVVEGNSAKRKEMTDAITQLDESLLDVTQLMHIAKSFQLWEQCLEILSFCDARDQVSVIKVCWTNIIKKEIMQVQERIRLKALEKEQLDSWTVALREKLKTLTRLYLDSDFMFPLDHIVWSVEKFNVEYRHHPDPAYVIDTFVEAGVSFDQLFQLYYNRLPTMAQLDERLKFHLLCAIYELISKWNRSKRSAGAAAVRRAGVRPLLSLADRDRARQALEMATICSSELRSGQFSPDRPVESLVDKFDSLKRELGN